jgi:hypothetical protein
VRRAEAASSDPGCTCTLTADCVEDGAGVIEAFLDVGGDGGAAEQFAHGVGDALETSAEQFGGGGFGFRAGGGGIVSGSGELP